MTSCKKNILYILFLIVLTQAKANPKIGLVLSGGGSKGFAHIATLKALDSLDIPIDYITGTSFGAIVGAMYALGYNGKQIQEMAKATDWYEVQKDEPERKFLPYFRKKDTGKYQLEFGLEGFKPVAPTGLIYGQKIILDLSKWTREFEQIYNFDDFPIPFRCNAFDIISGKEVVINKGSLSHALRASLSIPTIFAPVDWGEALLVDGGVANNLPVDIVKNMGADIILAVDVSTTNKSKANLTNIYDIIDQTISVHGYEKKIKSIEQADFYIRPEIINISFTDYSPKTMQYLFNKGEEAVKKNWDIFLKLKNITKDRSRKTKNIIPLKKPIINKIHIQGNKYLSNKFIRSYIGLTKGIKLDPKVLDNSISELYSLGYFKIIYYEIHKTNNEKVDVIIHVQETQLRKFYLGLRWDNLYHLVGAANIQLTSDYLPGIRIENEVQFAGIKKNEFSVSFPSKRLNFPIYPYIKIINSNYPFDLYTDNEYWGTYRHSSSIINSGFGLLFQNYWNTEFEYFISTENLQSNKSIENTFDINSQNDDNLMNKEKINGIRIKAQLDLLNDVLVPQNGILFNIKYENSNKHWGSSRNYNYYHISTKMYKTFHLNTYGLSAYYQNSYEDTPKYLSTLYGGNKSFVGAKEFQIHGSSLAIAKLDYRYKHKKDIFIHLIINCIINAKSRENSNTIKNIWGIGTGVTLLSPIGPLDFIWSWGPKNIYKNNKWQNIFHFSAGYKF